MTQQQIEQWIAQNGGPGAVQYGVEQKQVRNPSYNPDKGPRPGNEEYTSIEVETWKNSKTGAVLSAKRTGADSLEVYDNVSGDPNKGPESRNPTQVASDEKAKREQAERDRNAALSDDPAYETDEERRKRAADRITQQGRDAQTAATNTRQQEQDARQARIDEQNAATQAANASRAASAESRAAAAATRADNKTETVVGGDGKRYTRVTTVSADGNTVTVKNFGPDGKEVAEIPGETKDQYEPEPEGAPDTPLMVGQLTSGLRQYSQYLDQQVKLHKDTNGAQGVSPDRATKLMARRIALAESTIKEQENLTSGQKGLLDNATTQRGQSLSDTQNRRGVAERIATDVNRRGDERLKFLLPENAADHIAARQEEMQNALAYASQWGGMRENPEVDPGSFPALADLRAASMQGIRTPGPPPQIFDARTIQAPPPDPVAAAAAATMANPAFRPAPPVQGSVAAPIQPPAVNPVDGSPIALPTQLPTPSMTPGTPSAVGDTGAPPAPLPINPPAGENGNDPTRPVGMLPSTLSPRFMQEARYGEGSYFDPDLAGQQLSLELNIPPEIMKRAISGLYG